MLRRAGHTEAAVDLAQLAGLFPAGRDLRGDERGRHDGAPPGARAASPASIDLKLISIADLIEYRRRREVLVPPRGRGHDPHRVGRVPGLRVREHGRRPHPRRARRWARSATATSVLTRVHSECLTGDVFGSLRCDCGRQLERGDGDDRQGGPRRHPLHARPRGPRDRAHAQAPRLRAAGPGPRHGRGEPRARVPRRSARLRHRGADPRRPRRALDAAAHEQPRQARRPGGLRPVDRRAGPAADRADRAQRRLPAHEGARSSATCSTVPGADA